MNPGPQHPDCCALAWLRYAPHDGHYTVFKSVDKWVLGLMVDTHPVLDYHSPGSGKSLVVWRGVAAAKGLKDGGER